ncbi:hypothetical protein B7494_g4551 [Chlorociboria aeruginascens]|nr:hypothetical protein B7494_g4551 [Chlorociboria aeruginascens]
MDFIPQVSFQPPLHNVLKDFNRSLPASQQSPSIPSTFLDAMAVREQVFVYEQGVVPLAHHIDTDDARSYHWVLYAFSPSTHTTIPVATIRLVPFPHSLHPEPGSRFDAPTAEMPVQPAAEIFAEPPPIYMIHRVTDLHDGVEPYVKLGRLCVIKEFRGWKMADVLIQAALKWAGENFKGLEQSKGEEEGTGGIPEWKGLVGIHAREVAVRVWERNGFIIDKEMGSWFEAGIVHVGMFCRVQVGKK